MNLLAELKRRNVIRAALLYAGAVWALAQGIAQLGPSFGAPDWIVRGFVIACAIGFPFWLAFAWFFEFTPGGLKRESEIDPADPVSRSSGRKLDVWIIGVLAVAVVLLLSDKLISHRDAGAPLEKSVAVLPLVNESDDPKQDYFSDGLSEELISAIAQVRDIKVIGRQSSFRFRGSQQDDVAAVGATLGVATLLEGTVRKQGDQVRIVASLIKVSDGSTVWSQAYERELKDVFAVQSDIATSVAAALKTALLGKTIESADKPPGGNLDAYNALLQGRFYAERRNRADHLKAVEYYQQAITLDPGYAMAYARLAIAQQWFINWVASGDERKATAPLVRANAERALALDAHLAIALGALGVNQAWSDFDMRSAEVTLKRAVALDPANAETHYQLADVTGCLGRTGEASAMMQKVLLMEPVNPQFHFNAGQFLLADGHPDEAEAELRYAIDLQPKAEGYHLLLSQAYFMKGNFDQALATANAEPNASYRRFAIALANFGHGETAAGEAQLDDMIRLDADSNPGYIAEIYAIRGDTDRAFVWLDRGIEARDPFMVTIYEEPILIAALRHDPRLTALSKKLGLPDPSTISFSSTLPAFHIDRRQSGEPASGGKP
ncbi:MAG: tetratricopeptide repeat protein [Dokdonella sp.]